jgi:hypothetical protein
MTVEACLARAEASKFAYAGMEFGKECWMGNGLENVLGNQGLNGKTSESDCNMSCEGARGQLCGGASRMNLWVRNVGA